MATILFNTSTGSDTQASGDGPATAVFGTGASTTAASAVVDVSADAPDLSGVVAGDMIWVGSSSGRQWGHITAVDNVAKTVTCTGNTFANTESGKNWGIGGKRNDLDAASNRRLLEADIAAGDIVELETDQTISSTLTPTTGGATGTGPIWVRGNSASTRRTITQSANAAHFTFSNANALFWRFENLNAANSNATKTNANFLLFSQTGTHLVVCVNCSTDATNKVLRFLFRSASTIVLGILIGCDINNCTGTFAVSMVSSSQTLTCIGCVFRDNTGGGISLDSGLGIFFLNCLFFNNGGPHFKALETGLWTRYAKAIINCTADGATGANSGFDWSAVAATSGFATGMVLINNQITNNGSSGTAYGIDGDAGLTNDYAFVGYNNYSGNRTAAVNNFPNAGTTTNGGINDLALDPAYINAAGGNYAIGTPTRAKGYPIPPATLADVASGTQSSDDIGASQAASAGNTIFVIND